MESEDDEASSSTSSRSGICSPLARRARKHSLAHSLFRNEALGERILCLVAGLGVLVGLGIVAFRALVPNGSEPPCNRDTGGTCRSLECFASRGPIGPCGDSTNFACICKEGYCAKAAEDAWHGRCVLSTQTFVATVAPIRKSGDAFPGEQGKISTALCFSGGGSRSLSLSMGYLRALEERGLMAHVDAISAVSGGAWAATIYMFADMDHRQLLGRNVQPQDLTLSVLAAKPSPLGATATTDMVHLARSLVAKRTPSTRLWTETVGQAILSPFGLHQPDAFLAGSAQAAHRIRLQNPGLKHMPFQVPQPERPKVFVAGGALLAPKGQQPSTSNIWPLQMSPDFTGFPFRPETRTVSYNSSSLFATDMEKVAVGGGLIQTFAFGGDAPAQNVGGDSVKVPAPEVPFTLTDLIGISSAAFTGMLSGFGSSGLAAGFDPLVKVWPVSTAKEGAKQQEALTYKAGDGSIIEDSGVLAMLQRGARRVVWFINTDVGIADSSEFNWCRESGSDELDPDKRVSNQVYDKFGYGSSFLSNNQVFAKADLPKVVCQLQKLRDEGKPAVARFSHTVMQNSWWGITGGYTVDVAYVYNEVCTDFVKALPQETQDELSLGGVGEFANYPFYHTVFNNLGNPTSLSASQVNLLAAQAAYSISVREHVIDEVLREAPKWWRVFR